MEGLIIGNMYKNTAVEIAKVAENGFKNLRQNHKVQKIADIP